MRGNSFYLFYQNQLILIQTVFPCISYISIFCFFCFSIFLYSHVLFFFIYHDFQFVILLSFGKQKSSAFQNGDRKINFRPLLSFNKLQYNIVFPLI